MESWDNSTRRKDLCTLAMRAALVQSAKQWPGFTELLDTRICQFCFLLHQNTMRMLHKNHKLWQRQQWSTDETFLFQKICWHDAMKKKFFLQEMSQERLHQMTLECRHFSEDERLASENPYICHFQTCTLSFAMSTGYLRPYVRPFYSWVLSLPLWPGISNRWIAHSAQKAMQLYTDISFFSKQLLFSFQPPLFHINFRIIWSQKHSLHFMHETMTSFCCLVII